MSKRKTRNWPDMYPRKKRVYPLIPLADKVSICDSCINCVSSEICKNV